MAPILPGLSDRPEQLAEVVKAAREAGATGVWANLLYLGPARGSTSSRPSRATGRRSSSGTSGSTQRRAYLPRAEAEPVRERVRALAREHGIRDRRQRPARRRRRRAGSARAARVRADSRHTIPPMPDEITCLIVDDHEVVREGLRLSLSRAPHIRVIGEASDGAGAVALVERRRPARRDHGRPHARDGRPRGDEADHAEGARRRRC